MNKISLNLVAIAVAVITFSTLLGPLFNLSPVIPTLTVFGLLGLATIDNLSLQGKGGSLLLDLLSSTSAEHRDRIVRHEAGHFLVAYLFGVPVTGYALSAWEALKQKQTGLGGVSFADQELATQLQRGHLEARMLDRYCTIWMAGVAAETLVYGGAEGGADDRSKLRAVLTPLGFTNSATEQKQRFGALQASTLIQSHWSAYEALVSAMQQRALVCECYQVLEQHCQNAE